MHAGIEWKFSPADAPWQNGVVESLIKPVKKAIKLAIGTNVLKFSELQTVLYESSNLVNERPIGEHPTNPDDGGYLCPNDILLGRASSHVPSGPFQEVCGKRRFEFIQTLADNVWKKWTRNYFSSLIIQQKWHTARRNVKVDDVVIVKVDDVVIVKVDDVVIVKVDDVVIVKVDDVVIVKVDDVVIVKVDDVVIVKVDDVVIVSR